jgi:hypothetical protein
MKRIQASAAPLRAALSALLLGACVLQVSPALGQATSNPPERMTYQGFLVGSDGVALGNTNPKNYDVVFKVYDSENGNNVLWGEQQTVTVDKGYFSVLLGEGSAVGARPVLSSLFKGATASDRFVGITVQGIGAGGANVDILPRLRLMTSPYAFLAQNAVKLVQNNAAGTDLLTSSGNQVTLSGGLQVSGNNVLELGAGIAGKEGSAGKFGYAIFTAGTLDIVGAGTAVDPRKVKIWAEGGLTVTGPVTAPSFNGSFSGSFSGDGSGLTGVAKLGANTFTGYQEIQNHLRIGELASSGSTAGWGEALIFSGAPPLSVNADNSDPLWLARYNTAANSSELRMVIGDDPGSSADAFVIGTMVGGHFSQANTWTPMFGFTARGSLDFGYGRTKEVSAGTISYQVHSSDSLDIVGAGTTGSNRKIMMWAEGGAQLNGTLRVTGWANPTVLTEAFLYTAGAGDFPNLGLNYQNSIVADYGIRAQIFTVASDRRIKNSLGQSDGKADLATIKKIEITDYKYRDVVNHGPQTHKKVIAQQVEAVYPQAVSVSTGVLPDVYKKATSADGWIQLQADLKTDDRIRIVCAKSDQLHRVVAVKNPEPGSREEPQFQLDPPVAEGNVFVYGREVKDFRAVDYEAIAMLNVSATQELARRLERQDAELVELRGELAKARGEKQSLAENLTAMDARLARLEKVLKQQAAITPERARSGADLDRNGKVVASVSQ